jgi:two-component system, NarL family, sensor histidine kinase UhpB
MSLRARLILGIGLVLLASLILGSVLVCWQAARKVDTEMGAALAVGERTVSNAVAEAQRAAEPWYRLKVLVSNLDGERHMRATLIGPRGEVLARSQPLAPADAVPAWFYNVLAYRSETRRVALAEPLSGAILLQSDPHNEISEVWSSAVLMLGTLVLVCSLNAVLVYWITGRTLKPLNAVVAACARIGGGDYALEVPESGARELAPLYRGFNRMAGQLGQMARQQHRLEEQLVEVQEEERAELARDLHDEVGPLLFAVSVDLAALQQEEVIRRSVPLSARLEATRDATSRMQQHVRSILGRLRPPTVADLGLSCSIERLAAFWRTRYPAVTFHVHVSEESFSAEIGTRIYRIVQESISNAGRHGKPERIEVSVDRENGGRIRVQVRDDGVGLRAGSGAGLGLTGMRERVAALGGELEVSAGTEGRGVVVCARLPAAAEPWEVPAPVEET